MMLIIPPEVYFGSAAIERNTMTKAEQIVEYIIKNIIGIDSLWRESTQKERREYREKWIAQVDEIMKEPY